MNNKLSIDDIADFTWDFGMNFFLETKKGNYIWNDPDYGGDNTIVKTNLTLEQYFKGTYGRAKGMHFIKSYCGPSVQILDDNS